MKIKSIFLIAALAVTAPFAQAQLVFDLVGTETDTWSQIVDQNIDREGSSTTGTVVSQETFDLLLPKYNGIEDLYKVEIIINGSYAYTTETTLDEGSEEFNSVTVGASAQFTMTSPDADDFAGTNIAGFNNPIFASSSADSDVKTDVTISTSATIGNISGGLNGNIYNSEDVTGGVASVTPTQVSQLNSIFKGTGNIAISLVSSFSFAIDRDNPGAAVTSNFDGSDTGTVEIRYYTVPEPNAVLLLAGAGLLTLLRRRRRS